MSVNKKFKKGGASIFLVVVSCMFVAVIVASFVRLMIRDQQQASQQDLSQSAYDSAQAGVEDAKQFLNIWQSECQSGTNIVAGSKCEAMSNAINNNSCNFLYSAGIGAQSGETQIQSTKNSTDASKDLNQAYTCVKMSMKTSDYLGQNSQDGSTLLRLKPAAQAQYIRISWHNSEDGSVSNLQSYTTASDIALPTKWVNGRPAVIEAQLSAINYITPPSERSTESLDNPINALGVGSGKVTLYPATNTTVNNLYNTSKVLNFQTDGGIDSQRRNATTSQKVNPVYCKTIDDGGYSCSVKIKVPASALTPQDNQYTLLKLTSLYTGSNFKVEMLDSAGNVVEFDRVQPKVDSTGRANDRFRRVESRLSLFDDSYPLPDFAIYQGDSDSKLCKDFWVTNLKSGSTAGCEQG